MSDSASQPLPIQPESPAPVDRRSAVARARLAKRTLGAAGLLGITGDIIIRGPGPALGLTVGVAALLAFVVALAHERKDRLEAESLVWVAIAAFLASTFAWRSADGLEAFDFLGLLLALAFLAASLSQASPFGSIMRTRMRDQLTILLASARAAIADAFILLARDAALRGTTSRLGRPAWHVMRPLLIALPVTLFFALLLTRADPVFQALLRLPKVNWGTLIGHTFAIGFFAWTSAGWMREAVLANDRRVFLPTRAPFILGRTEITALLGSMILLFGAFVAVQFGTMMGGATFVAATTGLTYADYARRGFFELVWVALLVLPVLLISRAAIGEDDDMGRRRHALLSIALLGLLSIMMASAFARIRLYIGFYGLTMDRLFASIFLVWLGIVFAWYLISMLRGLEHRFAGGVVATGFATLMLVNLANPAAIVAKVNLGRASAPGAREADLMYLARIGNDAIPLLADYLARSPGARVAGAPGLEDERMRCGAASMLLDRLYSSPGGANDWRGWNLATARARSAIENHRGALHAAAARCGPGSAARWAYPRRATDSRPPAPRR